MANNKFVLKREDEEHVEVLLNGVEVASANHDEDGWGGMEVVVNLVHAIAGVLGIPVEEA
jgi:hypothetical protein